MRGEKADRYALINDPEHGECQASFSLLSPVLSNAAVTGLLFDSGKGREAHPEIFKVPVSARICSPALISSRRIVHHPCSSAANRQGNRREYRPPTM
ncbi:hypothetical protein DPEC_G00345450 [Dallia pectoralis]|uniref:Uncharacterized protein n=1 Tax=Dallia pectoralis TaxID=75939 RepID=A0ACC2F3H3_DALPE|nr:hypothetical protein DPEC_G00345450 [Dallia pectoralis]